LLFKFNESSLVGDISFLHAGKKKVVNTMTPMKHFKNAFIFVLLFLKVNEYVLLSRVRQVTAEDD